ncbi:MAG TPA: caspase family protein [Silvibacterium sp.]|nr:caspase family protein [Silvibacterium sp.]
MPNENHYAVVVGVDQYPDFLKGKKNLNCPQNDAKAIENWLLRADGGNLPPPAAGAVQSPNLVLITRDVPAGRPPPCPLINEIVKAIKTTAAAFHAKYTFQDEDGQAAIWNTSRLYLFFSGHGLDTSGDDAVLLGADTEDNLLFYVSVRDIVNKFKIAKTFREVVVWTDCCRTASAIPVGPSSLDLTAYRFEGKGDVRIFFARASKTQQPAYEPPKAKLAEAPNSFFTQALLDGLKGGVPGASAGLTTKNLRTYLELRVPELSQKYYNLDQYPEIAPDDYIELVPARAAPHYTARLKVASDSPFAGFGALRVFSGLEGIATVKQYPVNQASPDVFEASLPTGLYIVTPDLQNPASPKDTFYILGANAEWKI